MRDKGYQTSCPSRIGSDMLRAASLSPVAPLPDAACRATMPVLASWLDPLRPGSGTLPVRDEGVAPQAVRTPTARPWPFRLGILAVSSAGSRSLLGQRGTRGVGPSEAWRLAGAVPNQRLRLDRITGFLCQLQISLDGLPVFGIGTSGTPWPQARVASDSGWRQRANQNRLGGIRGLSPVYPKENCAHTIICSKKATSERSFR